MTWKLIDITFGNYQISNTYEPNNCNNMHGIIKLRTLARNKSIAKLYKSIHITRKGFLLSSCICPFIINMRETWSVNKEGK